MQPAKAELSVGAGNAAEQWAAKLDSVCLPNDMIGVLILNERRARSARRSDACMQQSVAVVPENSVGMTVAGAEVDRLAEMPAWQTSALSAICLVLLVLAGWAIC